MGAIRHLERMTMLIRIITILALAVIAHPLVAQDSHYWTNQYGTESWLLGGAVVGSRTDLASDRKSVV